MQWIMFWFWHHHSYMWLGWLGLFPSSGGGKTSSSRGLLALTTSFGSANRLTFITKSFKLNFIGANVTHFSPKRNGSTKTLSHYTQSLKACFNVIHLHRRMKPVTSTERGRKMGRDSWETLSTLLIGKSLFLFLVKFASTENLHDCIFLTLLQQLKHATHLDV